MFRERIISMWDRDNYGLVRRGKVSPVWLLEEIDDFLGISELFIHAKFVGDVWSESIEFFRGIQFLFLENNFKIVLNSINMDIEEHA